MEEDLGEGKAWDVKFHDMAADFGREDQSEEGLMQKEKEGQIEDGHAVKDSSLTNMKITMMNITMNMDTRMVIMLNINKK